MKSTYFLLIALTNSFSLFNNHIIINKEGVNHTFVSFDERTDRWITNVFPHWEPETFHIFKQVQDPYGIAIDLGAWIGATTIWLSKKFAHVLAIDADKISLQCLKNNLSASNCMNVTICEHAIAEKNKQIIFGPRVPQQLNDSMSYIKDVSDSEHDYTVEAITFKDLINKYINNNPELNTKKISFIKCDIEGGEEHILEDLLTFAYENKIRVYVSFHLHWWKNQKITDFAEVMDHFTVNCPESDICSFITKNPFCSLLFQPRLS